MTNEKLSNIIPHEKEVVLGDKVHKISKLPLGQYAKILLVLKKLPGSVLTDFQKVDTNNEEELFQILFGTVADVWEQVIEIIAIGSGIDKHTLETDTSIGLDGGMDLFVAIWEVNNLASVFSSVKNLKTRPMPEK